MILQKNIFLARVVPKMGKKKSTAPKNVPKKFEDISEDEIDKCKIQDIYLPAHCAFV